MVSYARSGQSISALCKASPWISGALSVVFVASLPGLAPVHTSCTALTLSGLNVCCCRAFGRCFNPVSSTMRRPGCRSQNVDWGRRGRYKSSGVDSSELNWPQVKFVHRKSLLKFICTSRFKVRAREISSSSGTKFAHKKTRDSTLLYGEDPECLSYLSFTRYRDVILQDNEPDRITIASTRLALRRSGYLVMSVKFYSDQPCLPWQPNLGQNWL